MIIPSSEKEKSCDPKFIIRQVLKTCHLEATSSGSVQSIPLLLPVPSGQFLFPGDVAVLISVPWISFVCQDGTLFIL